MRQRPLVDLVIPLSPEEVLARFEHAFTTPNVPCEGHVGRTELSVVVRRAERRFWSPWISLEVRAHADGTHLRGRFGPHPNLWTLFVLIYASLLVAVVSATLYAFGQWMTAQPPDALWGALGALVVVSLACNTDLVGRYVGTGQMGIVHDFLQQVLPEARETADPSPWALTPNERNPAA